MLYREERLKSVHPSLAKIVWMVSQRKSCFLVYGYRGKEDQNRAFETGHSKLKFPNSWHNLSPSLAVDLVPVDDKGNPDWNDAKGFKELYMLMNLYAKLNGITLVCGADWKSPVDLAHFQLKDRTMAEKPYTEFLIKKTVPTTWLPSDANMWLYNKNKQAGYPSGPIRSACDGTAYDWCMLLAIGAVTTEWFTKLTPDTDIFHIKCGGSIAEQAKMAVAGKLDSCVNVGDLPDFTDEQKRQICMVYTQLTTYLESMAKVRKPQPLPTPPKPEEPKPEPAPVPNIPPELPKPSPSKPVEPPKTGGEWKAKAKRWIASLSAIATLLGVVSFFVPALAPVAAAIKSVLVILGQLVANM